MKRKHYKAVLFDLDGTLLDTIDDLADSVNHVLESSGLPTHPVEAYRYLVGDGSRSLVSRALPEEERNPNQIETIHQQLVDE